MTVIDALPTIPRLDGYDSNQGGPGTALLVLARLEMEAAE